MKQQLTASFHDFAVSLAAKIRVPQPELAVRVNGGAMVLGGLRTPDME
jgi:hypothetical protein